MPLTVGEKLKRAREAQGMTISDVAERTKISAHYLEAIENNDFSILPGGVFNKGFVKLYARCVGIDEQEILQDYLRAVNRKDDVDLKIYKPEILIDNEKNSRLPIVIALIVVLSLAVWGGFVLINYLNSSNKPLQQEVQKQDKIETQIEEVTSPAVSSELIKLELKVFVDRVSVEATVDGKKIIKDVRREIPETYVASESLKIRYYRGFSDAVQLTLNGKQVVSPAPPKNRSVIEFEINKANLKQILENGRIPTAIE